jgi:hypothetical protein
MLSADFILLKILQQIPIGISGEKWHRQLDCRWMLIWQSRLAKLLLAA